MNVFIRADACERIGGGHVMRCLSLADELRDRGARACFVTRKMAGPFAARLQAHGHEIVCLEPGLAADPEADAIQTAALLGQRDCDWLIVDHYALDSGWERTVSEVARAILVVDDLADREHECQILLDQNYYSDRETRYRGLVPEGTRCLLGPHYALLRPQFAAARSASGPPGERLFVSIGATDPHGICQRAVEALRALGADGPGAEIVVGTDESLYARVSALAVDLPDVRVHHFVNDIAAVMARCTMAIGAGGSSTWERCAVGLPSLVVIAADNQRRMAQDLAQAQVIALLGEAAEVSADTIARSIAKLRSEPERRSQMRTAGMQLVDGNGVRRVANQLLECSPCSG